MRYLTHPFFSLTSYPPIPLPLPSDYIHTDADDVPPSLQPTSVRDEYWYANDNELLKVQHHPSRHKLYPICDLMTD